jgi:uncharacterized membrane protein
MTTTDLFLLIVRWLHLISAVAWIGGSLFYLVVLRPALRRDPSSGRTVSEATAGEFRSLVDTAIFVLLATGVILTFNRLTPGVVGAPYGVVLGLKIALSVWMFVMARSRRRRTALMNAYLDAPEAPKSRLRAVMRAVSGYNSIVILGIIVLLLSDLLKVLYELAISGR